MQNTTQDLPVSTQQLDELKLLFTNCLSPRRISTITTISQLVKILHKQNVIDTFHREPLLTIKNHLNISSTQIDTLTKDLFVDYVSKENNYGEYEIYSKRKYFQLIIFSFTKSLKMLLALERIRASVNPEHDQTQKSKFADLQFERNKQRIYKIIATEIGKKWKDFGRELGIIEGMLDGLDGNINERVYKIFQEFEDNCPPYERSAKINDALIECRRKDLSRKISDVERRL